MMAFEARYRVDPDPWRTLTDPYELEKRRRALAACGAGPFASACELGAGIGGLTADLAPRCARLLALDAAPTAVADAARRLAPFPQAEARVAVIPEDLPAGEDLFDLVVASELLYYLEDDAFAATAAWMARALVATGRLVVVSWTGSAHDLCRDAASVATALAGQRGLRLVSTASHPGHQIDVLERPA
jgi:cyclopropane fatty-acyl-phospholipid synthase-like methyltransferase